MVDDGLYEVYRTPDFAVDVYCAVSYVAEELGSPIAARTLLDAIAVDWQPFSGHFLQRLSPAFLNSIGKRHRRECGLEQVGVLTGTGGVTDDLAVVQVD